MRTDEILMATGWLPSETLQRRRDLQRLLLSRPKTSEKILLSEFLTAKNVLFFDGPTSKVDVAEALLAAFTGIPRTAALQALWERERESSLVLQDVAILRARVAGLHHLQAAIGICPEGVINPSEAGTLTRIFLLVVGPVTQSHLHMNLLASISALFRRQQLVEKWTGLRSSETVLQTLKEVEGSSPRASFFHRAAKPIQKFLHLRYGLGQ